VSDDKEFRKSASNIIKSLVVLFLTHNVYTTSNKV